MENVIIKDLVENEEPKKKKSTKKAAAKEEEVQLSTKQIFMIQCNERRRLAGISEMAYTEEEILNAK